MASTQSTIDTFFKTKKNARAALSNKSSIKGGGEVTTRPTLKPDETKQERTPGTPKRKLESDEEARRKRRREGSEERDSRTPRTPKGRVSEVPHTPPRSAKKRLIMTPSEGEDGKVEKDLSASPSKSLKLDNARLTPSQVKEKLGKCNKLDELKARLIRLNQCGEKLKHFRETASKEPQPLPIPSPRKVTNKHLEKFSPIEVEVPVSPRKTPVLTPIKSPMKIPAYERFEHLVAKPSEELHLPFKFRFVKEVFRAVDTVVSILHNREELITYSKLKPAVQEMLRRTFNERYLGQIKSVFPLAYFFNQECIKNSISTGTAGGGKSSYQLTIKANLDYKKQSAAQNLFKMFESSPKPQQVKFRKMDSVMLVERRNIFHNLLIDHLKEYHEQFLQSLDPPMSSASMSIKRWHPEFPLEEVPDLEVAPLPQPPNVETVQNARDMLEKTRVALACNEKLEKVLKEAVTKMDSKLEDAAPPKETTPQTPADTPNVCSALKGISASLLQKVRAKEAAKRAREMTRTSNENKELEMLSRLPEIVRIIRNTFIIEKKAALSWDMVADKIMYSDSSMISTTEVDGHIQLLVDSVPGWCTVHKVRSGVFLKIDKNMELTAIEDKIKEIIKRKQ